MLPEKGQCYICVNCEKAVFKLIVTPTKTTVIKSSQFEFLDGTNPVDGDKMQCGHCGEFIHPDEFNNIDNWE